MVEIVVGKDDSHSKVLGDPASTIVEVPILILMDTTHRGRKLITIG